MSRKILQTLLCAVALLAAGWAVARADESIRTWTDASGQFRIEAEFVEFKDGKAHLRRENGEAIAVPMSRLSKEDQRYVRELLAARKANEKQSETRAVAARGSAATTGNGEWPQWRGPKRDGISTETGLLDEWPQDGPRHVWQSDGLGGGYSSVAVAGGKIFTMGKRGGSVNLIALNVEDGSEVWSTPIGGGDNPNCTPTVDGDLVFGLTKDGELICAETETGKEVWKKNFKRDFGGRMESSWGYSESPLVDGDRLICTPGAQNAMLAALDKRTGEVIWKTSMPPQSGPAGNDGAGYSSVVISNAAGVRQYVQLVGRGVIGVATDDGKLLWGYNRIANGTANIPTPIVTGDFVFASTGYGDGGSALLRISKEGRGLRAEEVYYRRSNEMQNHHGGMILVGEYLYMGHGHNNGFPLCVHLPTGNEMWRPGRGPGSGSAAIAFADGDLYFRYESGDMALIEATPERYNLKSVFKIATRNDSSWPHPVIAGGKLYLRDQDVLHCYDIAQQ